MSKLEQQIKKFQDYCVCIRRLSPVTVRRRQYTFEYFFRIVNIDKLEDLSNDDIDKYIREKTLKGVKGQAINADIATIMAMVHFYQEEGLQFEHLDEKRMKKIKCEPTIKVFYSKEQIEEVLRVCDNRQWLMIKLCFDCGLRINELKNLTIDNIKDNRIDFIGKGNKNRRVYISRQTLERLNCWILENNVTSYIWQSKWNRSENGGPLSTHQVRVIMREPFYRLGYKDFYPHALRHSFATNICMNGAPLPVAQKMLGHSNIATTERYVHSFNNDLDVYFQKYSFAD